MATSIREDLHQAIDHLTEEQLSAVAEAIEKIQNSNPRIVLKDLSGFRLPAHWPPQFSDFEPLPSGGELASEQLIRERR